MMWLVGWMIDQNLKMNQVLNMKYVHEVATTVQYWDSVTVG